MGKGTKRWAAHMIDIGPQILKAGEHTGLAKVPRRLELCRSRTHRGALLVHLATPLHSQALLLL